MNKKYNVLGIDVSVLRPEKAVHRTVELLNNKGIQKIFFLTAKSSLYCKVHPASAELINSCDMILPGDTQTEKATKMPVLSQETDGICKFADEYMSRLFARLSREKSLIYAVMEKQEYLDAMKAYIAEKYPDLLLEGYVLDPDEEKSPDSVVNEINAVIPDIVLLCISPTEQLVFLEDYKTMMNTKLIICIENMKALLIKETEEIPSWVNTLHLEKIYRWLRKEQKLQYTIINSLFNREVKDEELMKEDSESNKDA